MEDEFIELLQSESCKQVNAALLYVELIHYDNDRANWTEVNWPKVNQAITEKWSQSGMVKVKTMAWQLVEGSHLKLTVTKVDKC